jgi:hypothetical protein
MRVLVLIHALITIAPVPLPLPQDLDMTQNTACAAIFSAGPRLPLPTQGRKELLALALGARLAPSSPAYSASVTETTRAVDEVKPQQLDRQARPYP